MLDPEQIRANYAAVASRVRAACERAGRGASEVTIVAVSKTFPAEAATAAIAAGVRDLGENRVQEAR
ncbi:MAG: YggS family pyridoxal phosphate-dependent enzyme, partial [Thermoanaerobaculia bacterium]